MKTLLICFVDHFLSVSPQRSKTVRPKGTEAIQSYPHDPCVQSPIPNGSPRGNSSTQGLRSYFVFAKSLLSENPVQQHFCIWDIVIHKSCPKCSVQKVLSTLSHFPLSSRQSLKDFSVLCNAWPSAQRSGNESKWQFAKTRNKQVLKSLFSSFHLSRSGSVRRL